MREFAVVKITKSREDPGELAKALIELANSDEPPLQLPLGPDALKRIAEKNAYVQREAEQWLTLASSAMHLVRAKPCCE
jgi:hypothetical protein